MMKVVEENRLPHLGWGRKGVEIILTLLKFKWKFTKTTWLIYLNNWPLHNLLVCPRNIKF